MIGFLQDLSHAFVLLRRNARFVGLVVALLGPGIGAAVVFFSAFDALLLRPLPVEDPWTLVRVVGYRPPLGERSFFKYPVYLALRQHATGLGDVCVAHELNAGFRDGENLERVRMEVVSASYFAVFGVSTHIGRVLLPEDEQGSADTLPAVLSYNFWRRRYQEDRQVLGRKVLIQGQPFVIVGVLPKGFNGASIDVSPDLRVPLPAVPVLYAHQERTPGVNDLYYEIVGRLERGVLLQQARDEAFSLVRSAMATDTTVPPRDWDPAEDFRLSPMPRGVSRGRTQISRAAGFLMAAMGVLLLMVCANVSGLLMARFVAREREFGLRLSLGATPGRLLRLALAESLLLATAGGFVAAVMSYVMTPVLVKFLPPVVRFPDTTTMPMALQIEPDLRLLLFGVAVTLLAALLVALAPALQVARTDIRSAQHASHTMYAARKRALLVLFQVSVCTVLLVSAGMLVQTLWRLRAQDAGFAKEEVVSFSLDPRLTGGTQNERSVLIRRLHEQVKTLPGVRQATLSSVPLMRGAGIKTTVAPVGERVPQSEFLNTSLHAVTPEYFDTLGLRLLAGRTHAVEDLKPTDSKLTGPSPVIVNETFVSRFVRDGAALGKQFGMGTEAIAAKPDMVIVGVVSNAKYRSLREPMQPTMYTPLSRVWGGGFSAPVVLHVRTGLPATSLIRPVRELLRALDSRLPINEITTLEEDIEASLWSEKVLARLATGFGLLASLIVATGLYALLSFVVTRRAREIGIRVALGERPAGVLGLLLRQTLWPVGAGIVTGLIVSFFAARAMQSLLYNVSTLDPTVFGLASILTLLVAGVAAALPALRVLKFEPAAALRTDG